MRHFRILFGVVLLLALLLTGVMGMAEQAAGIYLDAADFPVEQEGSYTSMEEVAVFLHTFGRLPSNFLTKREAQALGWSSREGNLGQVAPGGAIGGDHFGNYEGNLKTKDGTTREWRECDIDFDGRYRNAKRIVFSADGLIFYTEDHYNSFTEILVYDSEPADTQKPSLGGQ